MKEEQIKMAQEKAEELCSKYTFVKLYERNGLQKCLEQLVCEMYTLQDCVMEQEIIDLTIGKSKEIYNSLMASAQLLDEKYNIELNGLVVKQDMIVLTFSSVDTCESFIITT